MFSKTMMLSSILFAAILLLSSGKSVYAGECGKSWINPDTEAICNMTFDETTRILTVKPSIRSAPTSPSIGPVGPAVTPIGLFINLSTNSGYKNVIIADWGMDYSVTLPPIACGDIGCTIHYRYKNGDVCTLYSNGNDYLGRGYEPSCGDVCYRDPNVYCGIKGANVACQESNWMASCGTAGPNNKCIWTLSVQTNQSLPSNYYSINCGACEPTPTPSPTSTPTPTPTITPTPTPTSIPTPTPTPTTPILNSWIQVLGGDVHGLNANSGIPLKVTLPFATTFFIDNIINNNNSAGVFSTGSLNNPSPSTNISNPNDWLALEHRYNFLQGRRYDHSYFLTNLVGKLGSPILVNSGGNARLSSSTIDGDLGTSGALTSSNNYWQIEGLTPGSPGSLEVISIDNNLSGQIFLVSGNITITNDLTKDTLSTYPTIPIFISKGDIIIQSNVTKLNGVFITDGNFIIQNNGAIDQEITLDNGFAISYSNSGGFTFGRKVADNTKPSEQFIYSPSNLIKLISMLGRTQNLWQEVAP